MHDQLIVKPTNQQNPNCAIRHHNDNFQVQLKCSPKWFHTIVLGEVNQSIFSDSFN